jgi:hypothetical protein
MSDELLAQVACFAGLVATGAPLPADMRPMIDSVQRMFQELARTGRDFAELPGNEGNLGVAAIGRVFRDLEDLSRRWRAGFAPQAQRSRSPSTTTRDTRLEDCARSLAAAAAMVGVAYEDSEAWIGTVRDLHERVEDPLVQLLTDTAPDLEPELLVALEELRLAVSDSY